MTTGVRFEGDWNPPVAVGVLPRPLIEASACCMTLSQNLDPFLEAVTPTSHGTSDGIPELISANRCNPPPVALPNTTDSSSPQTRVITKSAPPLSQDSVIPTCPSPLIVKLYNLVVLVLVWPVWVSAAAGMATTNKSALSMSVCLIL